jgi:protein gp37
MGATTAIAWTDHTFNIAWGCFKVSPGCANCYAETFTERVGQGKIWGPVAQTTRRTFGAKHWNEPLKWNRQAKDEGKRRRVFSSSMCDIFEDHPQIIGELAKLWPLIRQTPWLEWQLLTKRYDRIAASLPADWGDEGYENVWLGVSVENQEWADKRIPALLRVPARVHFISYEPALGPVRLNKYLHPDSATARRLLWVIYGGESGPGYRHHDVQWARDARDDVEDAAEYYGAIDEPKPAFFYKQSSAPRTEMGIELDGKIVRHYPATNTTPIEKGLFR